MIKSLLCLLLLATAFTCQAESLQRRHVATSGHGEVKVKPDVAVVRLQVESTHRSGATAKEDVDQRINQALAALQKQGIKKNDMIASSLRISPNFDYRDRERLFTGYTASRDLRVTLKKLDNLSRLLDTALQNGVNQVLDIGLESSKAEEHRLRAHKMAIEDSKRKAAELAKAYNAELGPIFSINYSNTQVRYPEMAERSLGVMAMRAPADTGGQFLHDEIIFSDSIQVVFDLIPPAAGF